MAKIGELAMAVGRKVLNELPNKRYWNAYADYGDRIIYDKDVYEYIMKHMHFLDKLDIRKIVEAAFLSSGILNGAVEEPKEKNWKFKW